MEFVDTHCHPHFDAFSSEPEQVLSRAHQADVNRLVAVGTTIDDSHRAVDFADSHPGVWASAGVHPHEATQFLANQGGLKELEELLNKSSIVATGEIGLDFFKNFSSRQDQIKCLRQQIELGLAFERPFIFHIRDAWDDFWPLLDSYNGIKGVIHSFSSDVRQLENALSRGLYVGLNGIMTFTREQTQLDAAKRVPLNKLVLETDAPFLAPKPYRGKICEPKHIRVIAEFLAELRGEQLEDLARATTANAAKLFKLDGDSV